MKTCKLDYCEGKSYAKGFCSGHYSQYHRGQELRPLKISTGPASARPCSYDGCVNKQQAKGLCGAHWRQQSKGQELQPLRQQVSFVDRAMRTVIKRDDGCWIWDGRKVGHKLNYGQISYNGSNIFVHRALFEEIVRPLEPGETLDHLCRTTLCVNPEHLEPVPLRENVQRMHAYRSLQREIDRLRELVVALGGNPDER
jgi:HNH endonuclease